MPLTKSASSDRQKIRRTIVGLLVGGMVGSVVFVLSVTAGAVVEAAAGFSDPLISEAFSAALPFLPFVLGIGASTGAAIAYATGKGAARLCFACIGALVAVALSGTVSSTDLGGSVPRLPFDIQGLALAVSPVLGAAVAVGICPPSRPNFNAAIWAVGAALLLAITIGFLRSVLVLAESGGLISVGTVVLLAFVSGAAGVMCFRLWTSSRRGYLPALAAVPITFVFVFAITMLPIISLNQHALA